MTPKTDAYLAGFTSRLARTFSKAAQTLGLTQDVPMPNLKGLKPPDRFKPAQVIRASVPEGFCPFTESEISKVRNLADLIVEEYGIIDANDPAAMRRARKSGDFIAMDLPVRIQEEMLLERRSVAKRRLRELRNQLSDLLFPGLLRAVEAVESAALNVAAQEQVIAQRLGVDWEPSVIVRAVWTSAQHIRLRSKTAGYANSMAEATFGLFPEEIPFRPSSSGAEA